MLEIFVDTSGWGNLVDKSQPDHKDKDNSAWLLLSSREDKQWSLVDCSSFIIMKERGIREALTNDVHFEQAGFIRLLK